MDQPATPEHQHAKPLLTVDQQIAHLKTKGVTFDLCSEAEAAAYLSSENNYLRTVSYRVLFPKQVEGPHAGQYAGLDFAYLRDLSSIDRQLREALLLAAIDVEHFAKVDLLGRVVAAGEDGYSIVDDYFKALSHNERSRTLGGFRIRGGASERHDTYSGDLIARHLDRYPVWVLLEICEFGTFVDFYRFCAGRWGDRNMTQMHYALKSVKALRNASAHNHCIVNGFTAASASAGYKTPEIITASLNAAGMKNTRTRRAKLKNLRVAQIAATLFCASAFLPEGSTKPRHARRFVQVREKVETSMPYLRANNALSSFFDFTWKLVDIWLPDGPE